MRKAALVCALLFGALGVPATAAAQGSPQAAAAAGSCPPGAALCADPPQLHALPAGQPVMAAAPDATRDAPMIGVEPPSGEPPAPYEYEPPPRPRVESRGREWNLTMFTQGSLFARRGGGTSAMGGVGAGARYKPTRRFGIEGGLNFSAGSDFLGMDRSETALTFDALFFLNHRSVVQAYLLGGVGFSWARVSCDPAKMACPGPLDQDWRYFGAEIGGGAEARLGRRLGIDADLRGFLRGRTDDLASFQPEFVDADGRATNTSVGWLLRIGAVVYF